MIEEVKKHLKEVESFSGNDIEAIENFRLSYAGKREFLMNYLPLLERFQMRKKKPLDKH